MAFTKTITDCNTYFTTAHVKALDWGLFELDTECTLAFAQAKRELEVYLNRDLYDPATSDRYRDDYALYEQTLFILEQTNRTRQSETSAERIVTVDTAERDKFHGVTISPMAMRYMAIPRIRYVRG